MISIVFRDNVLGTYSVDSGEVGDINIDYIYGYATYRATGGVLVNVPFSNIAWIGEYDD